MTVTEAQYRELVGQKSGPTDWEDTYPGSSGDRERGKFRHGPTGAPRLTAVAVVGNDGEQLGMALMPSFEELIHEIRQLRLALTLSEVAQDLGDL